MATTLNTLYPPQVDTFMPSFCYNSSAKVWFNISSYNEDRLDQIKYIHVSMVDQRNNTNVFAGINSGNTVYPQFYPIVANMNKENNNSSSNKMGYDPNKQMYWIVIPPQVLKTSPYYNAEQYYKIQLRFDLTGDINFPAYSNTYANPTTFFYWNNASSNAANALQLSNYSNYNQDNFSEWSTGTLIKAILIPELQIQSFNISNRTNVFPSTDVNVVGKIVFNKAVGDTNFRDKSTEILSWYKIQILNNNKNIIHYESDIVFTDMNELNYRIDLSSLSVSTNYQMRVIYETNNGYTDYIDFPIAIINYTATTNVNYTIDIDEEIGQITLNISGLNNYSTGYLVIRRASYKTNFTYWELVAAKNISSISTWTLTDNIIESMTGYRYQLQYMTNDTIYEPIYTNIVHCDFYNASLLDGNKTLILTFNFQVSNWNNAVSRSKVDTLGGQYPIFTQNAKLKYHTYSINGRISTEDNGELFLPKTEVFGSQYYNYRYNYTPSGNNDPHNTECQTIKSNQDWLYEREYRNAVENWLNNGKPKLFRSMTEGNMIVMLDGISMTPDTVLGRRLYDFNATAYEIGDSKEINSIASFGLFDIIDER